MENYDELYKKGTTLMSSALDKYEAGNYEAASKDRQLANEAFDELEKISQTEDYKDTMLYGENRNFGIIYNVLESNLKDLYTNKNKQKIIGNIIKLIKENKVLKTEFMAYKNLSECKDDNTDKYVQFILKILPNFDKKTLFENNTKLIKLIRENKLNEYVDIDDKKIDLYESIEFILTNKDNINKASDYLKHEKSISDYLNENKKSEKEVFDIDEAINSIDEKYNELLTNEEKEFIVDNLKLDEQKRNEKFNDYKKSLIKMINEKIETSTDTQEYNGWCGIKNKLSSKTFDNKNFITDIAEMTEIFNTLTISE